MYNRILNRPMFKLGGKTNDAQGTGITSGLDTPRSQGYEEQGVEHLVEQLSAIDVSVYLNQQGRELFGLGLAKVLVATQER